MELNLFLEELNKNLPPNKEDANSRNNMTKQNDNDFDARTRKPKKGKREPQIEYEIDFIPQGAKIKRVNKTNGTQSYFADVIPPIQAYKIGNQLTYKYQKYKNQKEVK